jgi:hypothetical protein
MKVCEKIALTRVDISISVLIGTEVCLSTIREEKGGALSAWNMNIFAPNSFNQDKILFAFTVISVIIRQNN